MIYKKDFITYYAKHNEITKGQSREEIERFLDTFLKATVAENGVNLAGYIKTEVIDVPERNKRNPKTGEMIVCPAKKAVKIRKGNQFDIVNASE